MDWIVSCGRLDLINCGVTGDVTPVSGRVPREESDGLQCEEERERNGD